MKLEFDRWVLPPAVAAAVFAVMAAAPPSGAVDESLRIEGVQVGSSGLWLLRAAWESPESGALRAPATVEFSSGGRSVTAHGARGEAYAWASLGAAELRTYGELRVRSDGGRVEIEIPRGRRVEIPVRSARAPAALEVAVEGGGLITDETGEVLVRAPGATAVRIEPEMDGLTITPPRGETDGCGVARFAVRVEALGAPVRVVAEGSGATSAMRLPMRPGGLASRWREGVFEVRSAVGGGAVFLVGGTREGVTVWREMPWTQDGDRAVARWAPPPGVEWALASSVPNFAETTGGARASMRPPGCSAGEGSARWFAATEPMPEIPPPAVIYDGVAQGRARRAGRKNSVRVLGFLGLAISVIVETGLVLGAGFSNDAIALREVTEARRARWGVMAAAVMALAIAGFALAVSGLVRVGE